MKHKVGDKVTVQSLEWFDKNKTANNSVESIIESDDEFSNYMCEYCGKTAVITDIQQLNIGNQTLKSYKLDVDNGTWCWNDYMFKEN